MSPIITRPARSFIKVRTDHASETAQDYVEAIAEMLGHRGECRVRDLAAHMGVSHVTVNRVIARLKELDLVVTAPYRPIRLTAQGGRMAAAARRRHDLVLRFLLALGVPGPAAARDAEGIEHHVGDATLRCMEAFVRAERAGLGKDGHR